MATNGRTTFSTYFKNSIIFAILCVVGNLIACTLTAYALVRIKFRGSRLCFALMMMTMMLPQHAIIVPQYVYFYKLGWLDSFLPIVVPKFLATDAFFIYLIMQFIRGIPKELDEAAIVDGCSVYSIFYRIILPLCKPALVTTTIFTFMWSWNDFFTQNIYLRSVLIIRDTRFTDVVDRLPEVHMGQCLQCLPVHSPILVLFIFFQRQLVEGVATSGLKG